MISAAIRERLRQKETQRELLRRMYSYVRSKEDPLGCLLERVVILAE